jgi:hypothetical protein
MMGWYQIKQIWRNDADVWLELADAATSSTQRAYCVKQWQTFKPLPWYRKILKIVLDFFRFL